MVKDGEWRLSHRATQAALLILLYRDQPILYNPYKFLTKLIDVDELITTWRYRHVLMVSRMIGKKIGTGGSEYNNLNSELSENFDFTKGSVGMVRRGKFDTENSQFFILICPYINFIHATPDY